MATVMDIPNAYIGRASRPSDHELHTTLGASAAAWDEFIASMARDLGVSDREWKCATKGTGWSLRLRQKGRNIVYLSPCKGCFRISFTLSDKAVEAARHADLPHSVQQALAEAPRYPEGTGVRLMIQSKDDLEAARALAALKVAN